MLQSYKKRTINTTTKMGLKLYGVWYSLFEKRVEIALKLKGVEYEYVEDDLINKSEELLKYNPIHKKVPVLIHDGKILCESLVILEYIDEIWKANPLLPSGPYERAKARFWTKFLDETLLMPFFKTLVNISPKREAEEALNKLENAIKEKKILRGSGKEMGYLEIVAVTVFHWMPVMQEALDMELLSREKHPSIFAWAEELSAAHKFVQETLSEKPRMLEHYIVRLPAMRAELAASK